MVSSHELVGTVIFYCAHAHVSIEWTTGYVAWLYTILLHRYYVCVLYMYTLHSQIKYWWTQADVYSGGVQLEILLFEIVHFLRRAHQWASDFCFLFDAWRAQSSKREMFGVQAAQKKTNKQTNNSTRRPFIKRTGSFSSSFALLYCAQFGQS